MKNFMKIVINLYRHYKQWGKIHNLSAELETQKIEKNIMDSIYPLSLFRFF